MSPAGEQNLPQPVPGSRLAARTLAAALATLVAGPAGAAPAASTGAGGPPAIEWLAVLTPRAPWSEQCVALAFGATGDRGLAARCRLLEMVADDIRGVAARAHLAGTGVLDRDETLRRVRRMRRPPSCPSPEECDLDTARLLSADEVLSARVSLAGDTWSARLELRRVSSGRLVAAAAAAGRGTSDLRASVRAATGRLLRASLEAGTTAPSPGEPAGR